MSVVFSYAQWAARFPELADAVAEPLATAYWEEAGLYLSNDATSRVKNETRRALILNLMTAHIAALNAPVDGIASPLVGRISSATQGSVTVQTDLKINAESAQWWAQTKYGLQAWQALAPYRTAVYVPGNPRRFEPYSGGYGG